MLLNQESRRYLRRVMQNAGGSLGLSSAYVVEWSLLPASMTRADWGGVGSVEFENYGFFAELVNVVHSGIGYLLF